MTLKYHNYCSKFRFAEDAGLNCPVDSDFLVKFLRAKKGNVDNALQTVR
jgi:hypothetical protein